MTKYGRLKCQYFTLEHLFKYPTNVTLGYLGSFGSLAGFCLGIQIFSGLLLTIHYLPSAAEAFSIIEHISREVNFGGLIRYAHSNGASFFFIVLYIHIFRSLMTASYSRTGNATGLLGVVMFILIIATAFFGYVLPGGQMSLWGATVITNLFSAVPVVGTKLVLWLGGGFSVDTPTLGKFFTLHFLLPFLIAGLAVLHILFLHETGSSSQLTTVCVRDQKYFFSYYAVKDLLGILYLLIFLGAVIIYAPNFLGHPDNYIEANHMVTPLHIVPEGYFLPFYAILRSVPNKLNGVVLMFGSLVILFIFPFFQLSRGRVSERRQQATFLVTRLMATAQSSQLNVLHLCLTSYFVIAFLLLGWLGGKPAVEPYTTVSLGLSVAYFMFLLLNRTVYNVGLDLFYGKVKQVVCPTKAQLKFSNEKLVSNEPCKVSKEPDSPVTGQLKKARELVYSFRRSFRATIVLIPQFVEEFAGELAGPTLTSNWGFGGIGDQLRSGLLGGMDGAPGGTRQEHYTASAITLLFGVGLLKRVYKKGRKGSSKDKKDKSKSEKDESKGKGPGGSGDASMTVTTERGKIITRVTLKAIAFSLGALLVVKYVLVNQDTSGLADLIDLISDWGRQNRIRRFPRFKSVESRLLDPVSDAREEFVIEDILQIGKRANDNSSSPYGHEVTESSDRPGSMKEIPRPPGDILANTVLVGILRFLFGGLFWEIFWENGDDEPEEPEDKNEKIKENKTKAK